MKIDDQISQLLLQEEGGSRRKLTLILVVGDEPRNHIENGLTSECGKLSSIAAIGASRTEIDVLFLSKLQYLFMYLMKFEAEEAIRYNYFVIYGLDQGILSAGEQPLGDQLRIANLICNAAFRIKRKHGLLDVRLIACDEQNDMAEKLIRIESYWRHIC
ncbi:hypothetical protein HG537_0A04250 [Torulaspora globosa]|uniref:Uncharacterized protein n=1 Tax=Torulaspora globosa TaxID=48254 RepID=A0A7H9HJZ1_9SACH|nr:hypothetical protein HG537_0A04250 [Torulaspora sp. CBS 2947]